MKVISTNIGQPTTFVWNGKEERTGIFKHPVSEPLFLHKVEVAKDTVIDRVHHGGVHKACYLFSWDQYPYWKKLYPDLEWDWGMFGENLTVEGLDETAIRVGDVYKVGTAMVQVSQPREPCYKLGVRFGTQKILKQYLEHGMPGTYVRILKEGAVKKGDMFHLVQRSETPLTTKQFFELINSKDKDKHLLQLLLDNDSVPAYKKDRLRKYL